MSFKPMIAMSVLKPVDRCVTCQRIANPNVLQYAYEKRNKGFLNDVTIGVGDQTIAANRLILSCCSRFFEAMFDLEMKEKYQNPVQIHGVDGAAVKSVIDFMYSGEVKITSENVMELIAASDYLQFAEVKRFCFEFLESILSLHNWFAVYSAAKLYGSEHLQNEVYEYVSNNFNDVIQTDDFKLLSDKDFTSFFFKVKQSQTEEVSLFKGLVTWCRHNERVRKRMFSTLFKKFIDLDEMPINALEEIVLKEELISKQNIHCLKIVTNYLCQQIKSRDEAKILSLGGGRSLSKCTEVYSRSTKPQQYPDLPLKVNYHCSLKSGNFVYLIGGCSLGDKCNWIVIPNVWCMNTQDQVMNWKKAASLNEKRYVMGGTVFRDTLVVAGGYNESLGDMNSVEYYQAAFDEWKFGSPLQKARSGCAMVASDEHLYVIGGRVDDKCSSSVERIGNLRDDWEEIQSMQMPRRWFAAAFCFGFLYVMGGQVNIEENVTTRTVEKYDFDEKKWIYVSSMITERRAHAACVMNGLIYVIGGLNASNKVVNSIDCFNPKTDSWKVVGSLGVNQLYNHSLIVL